MSNSFDFQINQFSIKIPDPFLDHTQRELQFYLQLIECMTQYALIQPFASNETKVELAEFIRLLMAVEKYSDEVSDYKNVRELNFLEKHYLREKLENILQ